MKQPYQQELVEEEQPVLDEPEADEAQPEAEATEEPPATDEAESIPAHRQRTPGKPPASRSRADRALLGLGALTAVSGIGLAALGDGAGRVLQLQPEQLARLGVSPFGFLSTGILLLTAGIVLRKLSQAAASVRGVRIRQKKIARRVRAIAEDVGSVHENMLVQMDRPPASGEELNRVLQALKKQEEKLISLTKASMSSAKPVVELGSQYKDLAAKTNGLQEAMEDLNQKLGATGDRMETRSREVLTKVDDTLQSIGRDLQQSLSRQIEGLGKALEARDDGTAELDKLSRQIDGLGKALEARGNGAAELDKLTRQVDGLGKTLEARGSGTAELDKLTRQVEALGKALEARGSGTGELDKLARQTQAIQESVAGLAQQIAQGIPAAAAAGPASPAGGGTGAAMPAVPAAAAARLAAAASAEPAKVGTGDVQGAIAKLKKLRGR
jgi:uncharacterized coiled-coil DUF342 family protein